MQKAYKLTPAEYQKKRDEMSKIVYRYGDDARHAPEEIREKYNKLKEETKLFPIPEFDECSMFFRNPEIYNLWLNRDMDEPVTSRELFKIIWAVKQEIEDAASRAACSAGGWE